MPRAVHEAQHQGALVDWDDARGFGFIEPAEGGSQVFAHISAFPQGYERPQVGNWLSFDVETNDAGKLRAANIGRFSAPIRGFRAIEDRRDEAVFHSVVAIVALVVVYGVIADHWGIRWWTLVVYLVMSAVTFRYYARDKAAAKARTWRVRESALINLGVLGGWPGAVLAQQLLRHKTSKRSFRRMFWASVVLNVLLLLVVSSPAADRAAAIIHRLWTTGA